MALNVTFKDLEATEAIKEYAEKKIEKFKKYITYPMDTHIILSIHRGSHKAEITCHAEHKPMVAVAESADLYNSIDAVVTKVETQLKKEREKRKGHSAAGRASRSSAKNLASDVEADIPHRGKK